MHTTGRQVRQGDRLQLALGPENIDMSPSPMAPEANTCTGTIGQVVYLGTVAHGYVTSKAGEAFVISYRKQAALHPRGPLRVGDAIHLS